MTFRLRNIVVVLLVALLGGCGYPEPPMREPHLQPTATMGQVVAVAQGEGSILSEGVVVEGVVTANDKGGNFYRTIVVEDSQGALELFVGLYDLHLRFPVGAVVRADLSGLACRVRDGVVQLGRLPYDHSPDELQPLGTLMEVDRRMEVVAMGEEPEPQIVAFEQLAPQMCGRLVRFEALRFVSDSGSTEDIGWGTTEWGTVAEREFVTPEGDTLVVATSLYADFAAEKIPDGWLSLSGILYCEETTNNLQYKLKLRTRNDVEQ